MKLEIDNIEELKRMFKDKESKYALFIGQLNRHTEKDIEMIAIITIRFTEYNDNTIIEYTESLGVAEIPMPPADKPPADDRLTEEERKVLEDRRFAKQKEQLDTLQKNTDNKITEMIQDFQKAGFTVFRGVWTNES
jgi:hypothetical protein